MINLNTVSKALFDQIAAYQPVKDFDPILCHGEFVGVDPNKTPWIGVFRDSIRHAPRTLGHNQWRSEMTFKIVVQAASFESGEDCQILLDSYVREVTASILSDLTFSGAVDMTTLASVDYNYVETDRESLYYQSAIITVESEGRSNV